MLQKIATLFLLLILWQSGYMLSFWMILAFFVLHIIQLIPVRRVKKSGYKVCIVGAGFSGLAMAKRLKDIGVEFLVVERSPDLGGTWYQNRYPGCSCDVASPLYSYSFFPNPDFSRRLCGQSEILEYLERFADEFDLRRSVTFDRSVRDCVWNKKEGTWRIGLDDGSAIVANAVVSAVGTFPEAHVPSFKNRDLFAGDAMHSTKWDYGWDPLGKTVAVVGTGATAVQIVPQLAKTAKRLVLFQRSAAWAFPMKPLLYPKCLRKIFRHLPFILYLYRLSIFCTNEFLFFTGFRTGSMLAGFFRKLAVAEVESVVRDVDLQKRLTPNYELGCKRITPSSTYLQAFNRSNVDLVTSPITEFTERSITTEDGGEYHVDAVVYATGFDRSKIYRCTFKCRGIDGRELAEEFGDKPEAYLGITHPSAPNFFILLGPNTGLGHSSAIWMLECQVDYVEDCLRKIIDNGLKSVVVKKSVFEKYQKWLKVWMKNKVFQDGSCVSWYKNKDNINFALWPSCLLHYWWLTKKVNINDFEVNR